MLFLELYYFCSFYKQNERRFITIKNADIQLFMRVVFGAGPNLVL